MPQPEFTCSVTTQFLPEQSDPARSEYAFSYTVTIRNTGDVRAQLVGRHWVITDAGGQVDEVRGLAVVGYQPVLGPGEKFEYSSWTRLKTPRGRMQGTYFCMTEDAHWFEAPIAPFELSMAQSLH